VGMRRAVWANRVDGVEWLVQLGFPVTNALEWVDQHDDKNDRAMIRRLIQLGASLDHAWVLFRYALEDGNQEVVEPLIDGGMDPNGDLPAIPLKPGETPHISPDEPHWGSYPPLFYGINGGYSGNEKQRLALVKSLL